MSTEVERLRKERDFVANRYGPGAIFWMEKVAGMPTDQVTAIYLQMKSEDQKPRLAKKIREDLEGPDPPQQKLF